MEIKPDPKPALGNLQPQTQTLIGQFNEKLDLAFEGEERARIGSALDLMVEVHSDQEDRPDGTPYVEHPLGVADQVLASMQEKDPDLVIAALLHDAVEDQAAKLAKKAVGAPEAYTDEGKALYYIETEYGPRVGNIVSALSNPDFEQILQDEGEEVTAENKNRLYAEHVKEAIEDPDVFPIKCFDFAANTLRLDEIQNPAKKMKLLRKYTPVVGIFIDRIEKGGPVNMAVEVKEYLLAEFKKAHTHMQAQLQGEL